MKGLVKFIKATIAIIVIGVAGFALSKTPDGKHLEEVYGLHWLFKLRGKMPSPPDIVIILMDQASAEVLGLPDDPEHWPRTYYAQLIDKINQQQPAVLAMNIHFREEHESASDQLLADAMTAKKNVILNSYLKQKSLPNGADLAAIEERSIEPIPLFTHAALGTPPFPIMKSAESVKDLWIYKHSAGDVATFPMTIFQYYVVKATYPEILDLLAIVDPKLKTGLPGSFSNLINKYNDLLIFQDIQDALFKTDEKITTVTQLIADAKFSSKVKRLLSSWLALTKVDETMYLNHYGDVGTIKTLSFYQALLAENTGNLNVFRDKIVMIGYADNLEPEKQQGLYNTFSKDSGKVISLIEVAATGVANMIGQSWLKTLSDLKLWSEDDEAWLILAWGVLLSGLFYLASFPTAMVIGILLTGAYVLGSVSIFTHDNIWLPLVIPLAQSFFVLSIKSISYFMKFRQVSHRYLPKEVFEKNARDPKAMHQFGTLMQGVCLATDAGQYTALSETIPPLELHRVINDYYAAIFPRVKSRKGLISDVIGDAMLAVWASPKVDAKLRLNACHAALEIKSAVVRFNETGEYRLETRMGLHYGEMRLGNVGSHEHFEYRAVGDTVNTATRIEGLNKLLGTRVLVSAQVIEGMQGFFSRELGTFLLKGKTQAIKVFELVGRIDEISEIDPNWPQFAEAFADALQCFKKNKLVTAIEKFQAIQSIFPDDGPSRFYINYLQCQIANPTDFPDDLSKDHAGVINVGNITV